MRGKNILGHKNAWCYRTSRFILLSYCFKPNNLPNQQKEGESYIKRYKFPRYPGGR